MKVVLFLMCLMLSANAFGAEPLASAEPASAPAAPGLVPQETTKTDVTAEALGLYTYKPVYFLVGGSYAKLQISFETQIVSTIPIYFGYSQLMMWDVFTNSPFFYDINFNPLFWYRLPVSNNNQQYVDLIPWEHESNGKGEAGERSWDRIAAMYHRVDKIGTLNLQEELKVWVVAHTNGNNNNIEQYRGTWELNLKLSDILPFFDVDDVMLRLYPGGRSYTDPTHGGQELTLRTRWKGRKFLPFAVFQVFHGYGEYLQDYQLNQWGVRAGLGF